MLIRRLPIDSALGSEMDIPDAPSESTARARWEHSTYVIADLIDVLQRAVHGLGGGKGPAPEPYPRPVASSNKPALNDEQWERLMERRKRTHN